MKKKSYKPRVKYLQNQVSQKEDSQCPMGPHCQERLQKMNTEVQISNSQNLKRNHEIKGEINSVRDDAPDHSRSLTKLV